MGGEAEERRQGVAGEGGGAKKEGERAEGCRLGWCYIWNGVVVGCIAIQIHFKGEDEVESEAGGGDRWEAMNE
jgi:hypothetical protein